MLNVLKSSLLLLILVAPGILGAQGVVQLTGISFGSDGTGTIGGYVQALYFLAIGIGAALAVLRLILAGAKYMLTDVVTQKGEAKQDVYAGVVGLLIILAAVLILETINPQLNNLDVLNLSTVNRPATQQSTGTREFQFNSCQDEGGRPITLPGQGRQSFCCTSATDHVRCAGVFPEQSTPTVNRTEFASREQAESAAAECSGQAITEPTRDRRADDRYVALCPIIN